MKNNYSILAIETSLDETCAAVTVDTRIFSNVISSQVELHKKWGGVVPIIAQRAHRERIDFVIAEALSRFSRITNYELRITKKYKKSNIKYKIFEETINKTIVNNIDAIAVTQGPGQALALEVGITKAKELATKLHKPLIAVSHLEGHLLSPFATNSKGKNINFQFPITPPSSRQTRLRRAGNFPMIGLLVSGGHTMLVLVKNIGEYEILGETLDDAAGEAFDKVGRMLNIGYPGGPILEEFAKEGDAYAVDFPIPMKGRKDYMFSYSGLKTAVLYKTQALKKEDSFDRKAIVDIAASFQRVLCESLIIKLESAVKLYKPKAVLFGGGVMSNVYIRKNIRSSMRRHSLPVYTPYSKTLYTDNAGMIGVAAYFKAKRGEFVKDVEKVDRKPNLTF